MSMLQVYLGKSEGQSRICLPPDPIAGARSGDLGVDDKYFLQIADAIAGTVTWLRT